MRLKATGALFNYRLMKRLYVLVDTMEELVSEYGNEWPCPLNQSSCSENLGLANAH